MSGMCPGLHGTGPPCLRGSYTTRLCFPKVYSMACSHTSFTPVWAVAGGVLTLVELLVSEIPYLYYTGNTWTQDSHRTQT